MVQFDTKIVTSHSSEETIQCGVHFAKSLRPGDVVAVEGDLGSGKTTLIKGIAQGLGCKDLNKVKSPTFVIMHIYEAPVPIYHFDLYRFEGTQEELDAIGFDQFIRDPKAVSCIEWAQRAGRGIPEGAYWIRMSHVDETSRKIEILKK